MTQLKRKKMLTLESLNVALRSEKLEGDLGEGGLESWNNLGLLFFFGVVAVLHWSFGLLGTDEVCVAVLVREVRHRRLGLETGWDCKRGVDGLEKNPNLELILGLWLLFSQCWFWCFSVDITLLVSLSLGMDVQNALLQPVTILVWFFLSQLVSQSQSFLSEFLILKGGF